MKKARNELFEKKSNHQKEKKLTFNIAYHPAYKNDFGRTAHSAITPHTKTILRELRILLAPDKEFQKVFPNVPIV